jgi:NDP-sugar pyrophosphorylase family protein
VQKPFDSRADVIHIEKTTGQADTIYQTVKNFMPTTPVIVADCDMILSLEDMVTIRKLLGIYDMVVAVTETFDPNASRVDQVPHPNRFVEKEPISQWGIVGVRAFNKAYLLKDALLTTLNDCKHRGVEPYISMAMNYYPGTRYAYVVRGFQDWGTPERLKESGAEIVDKGRN